MYSYAKEREKERDRDIKQLWDQLRNDGVCFSENLEWLVKKSTEVGAQRSFWTLFAIYLSVMIRVDNLLFLGRTFRNVNSPRVGRVTKLLMTEGYADRIVELTLGAAYLYERTKHKKHQKKIAELRELAKQYKIKLAEYRREFSGDKATREADWAIIRVSNLVFARVYDIVKDGTTRYCETNTYYKSLHALSDRDRLHKMYASSFERIFDPRSYWRKRILSFFKTPRRNKRKTIRWEEIAP